MSEVVKGMPVDVPAAELTELASARAKYHEAKAAFYASQAVELEKGEMDDPQDGMPKSMNALQDLRRRGAEHTNKARYLDFVADHVTLGATYRLDKDALTDLGIVASRY